MNCRLGMILVLVIISDAKKRLRRGRRQSCECTQWQSPKCSCQIVPSADGTPSTEMLCSCVPPSPPKCLCTEPEKPTTTTTTPPTPSAINLSSSSTRYSCQTMCTFSCMDSCAKLSTNGQCMKICTEACDFSCAKQENTSKESQAMYSEYKFILPVTSPSISSSMGSMGSMGSMDSPPMSQISPSSSLPMAPHPSLQSFTSPPPSPTFQTLVPVPYTMSPNEMGNRQQIQMSKPTQPVCLSECMPECSLACTTVREAMALLRLVVDNRQSTTRQCEIKCADSCSRVCTTTGLPMPDCLSNCSPACQETCSLTKPLQCPPRCLPECTPSCLHIAPMSSYPSSRSSTISEPSVGRPRDRVGGPSSVPRAPSPPTSSPIVAACQHECSVQCEQQCGLHSVSGPACLSSCQTTCHPVCVQKMRRKPTAQPRYNGY